ncbi:MAG: alpha/beta hydrolase [Bacteroidota bacterium]|nr:alpha/beta hydrolase [Bacteroidota bacterium]
MQNVQTLTEQTITDVSYGSDPAQKMDVYLPADRTVATTKVFIMIHGGAWESGDKIDFNEYIPVFKQRLSNYAIFNINYRLTTLPFANTFPTQENDVKAAFDFIIKKATAYKFNADKLAVLGASAGGHLALLQAYKNAAPKVKALVDMFGPTDMIALYNSSPPLTQTGMNYLLNGTPSSNPTLYQSSSPINYVTAQSPPTLILHGGVDPLVPIAQSTALKNKLVTAGVPVQMVTYPLEGHGWTGASLSDTYDKITGFLTTYNQ